MQAHTLDVDELQSQNIEIEFRAPTPNSDNNLKWPSCSIDSCCTQRRKNLSIELLKVKKKFFEDKMEKEGEINRKLYVEESLKYKKRKIRSI